jgi:hypothetical protein
LPRHHGCRRQGLEILKKQFALGGDVELAVVMTRLIRRACLEVRFEGNEGGEARGG